MHVLQLSWEYPPLVVGGLGRHVEALSTHLVRAGDRISVVTRGEKPEPSRELVDGVEVVRARADPLAVDFTTESLLSWSQAHEHALLRAALPLVRDQRPDVLHAHDWLAAQTAVTLRELTGVPLVVTLHATEAGRHQGWLPAPLNRAIHSVERWLAGNADMVITCSRAMREETRQLFGIEAERVQVIPNGVDTDRWRPARRRRGSPPAEDGEQDGPLLVYAGRLVHEKGVDTLLRAVARLRRQYPGLRLAIAGTGGYEPRLRELARRLRIARAVRFHGFLDAAAVARLVASADVAVVPSRYEPFGLAALEAAAVGSPLVVADTGGLSDLLADHVAVAGFPPGDDAALAAAIGRLLADPAAAARSAARARRVVRRDYTWASVATRTQALYRALLDRG